MFEVKNEELMSPDTQKSLRMLYERTFEPDVAKKVLKLVTEADKNYQRLVLDFNGKPKEEITEILKEESKLACEKLDEHEVLYNYPISAQFINGLAPFIN